MGRKIVDKKIKHRLIPVNRSDVQVLFLYLFCFCLFVLLIIFHLLLSNLWLSLSSSSYIYHIISLFGWLLQDQTQILMFLKFLKPF